MMIMIKFLSPDRVKGMADFATDPQRGPANPRGHRQVALRVSGERTHVPPFRQTSDQKQSSWREHSLGPDRQWPGGQLKFDEKKENEKNKKCIVKI